MLLDEPDPDHIEYASNQAYSTIELILSYTRQANRTLTYQVQNADKSYWKDFTAANVAHALVEKYN